MDQDTEHFNTQAITTLGHKSWTAYIRPTLAGLGTMLFLAAVTRNSSTAHKIMVLSAPLCYLIYSHLMIRSYRLYFDDVGVWVYSGILPWNKGINGVKWRDLDGASFKQSLGSWLFKSYSIHISHRFTKSNEIWLSHWAGGNEAVTAINQHHQALAQARSLH